MLLCLPCGLLAPHLLDGPASSGLQGDVPEGPTTAGTEAVDGQLVLRSAALVGPTTACTDDAVDGQLVLRSAALGGPTTAGYFEAVVASLDWRLQNRGVPVAPACR